MADSENQAKTDGRGIALALQRAANGQYLGDHETVDRLVRDFATSVLERFEKVADGRMLPNDASAADQTLCMHMADIFLGKALGYTPVPDWNDGAIALYIAARCKDTIQPGDNRSIIAQAFAMLAHTIYDQIRIGSDEETMQSEINEAIRSLTMLLLGVGEHD